MEESFFGFNTSTPGLKPLTLGEASREGSEEEYDALNNETFGADISGDWENTHDNLVRGLNGSKYAEDNKEDSDLEINLSKVKINDVNYCFEDNDNNVQLNSNIWSRQPNPKQNVCLSNPEAFLRRHFSNPFENSKQQQNKSDINIKKNIDTEKKICTVQDIERNILNQQQQQQKQDIKQNVQQDLLSKFKIKAPIPNQSPQMPTNCPPYLQQNRCKAPPGFGPPNMGNFIAQYPMGGIQQRIPPGFNTLSVTGGYMPHPGNFSRPISHNMPVALNNYAVHPNYNMIRGMNPSGPNSRMMHPSMMVNSGYHNPSNHFNQRLVQEIQQNHPMLANVRVCNNNVNQNHSNFMHKNNNKSNNSMNGNMFDIEHDEYANLMSARVKHWLIGIQLSQLNTGTPYIDDYYYTVFKERKAKLRGDCQSKAHKVNQLNHPLTQPKGHAQLVLIQLGRNGTNPRNGQNRERKNSESKGNDKEPIIRTFTPLHFENSLGKLQFASITAPRKIIDMEVISTDNLQLSTAIELSAQRKSRQLLLHIETLYRIVLKLEDLNNPVAIIAMNIVKERKEKLKQMLSESSGLEITEKAKINSDVDSETESGRSSLNESFGSESKEKLLQKLIAGISIEKVVGIMNFRKGKTLIRRIFPLIEDNKILWNLWMGVFTSLPTVLKKDKDDNDGVLFSMFSDFRKHIENADMHNIVKISETLSVFEGKFGNFLSSKFCVSALVSILHRAEEIYSTTNIDTETNKTWSEFLAALSKSLINSTQNRRIGIAVENDVMENMIKHFSRFTDYKLDSLLTLFIKNRNHFN